MIYIQKLEELAKAAGDWTEPGPYLIEVWSSTHGYYMATERDMEFIAAANPAAVLELIEEIKDLSHWRDLALQFDNHRMAALWHLKALLQSQEHVGAAHEFLESPPMAAHEVVEQRDQLKAENEALLREIQECVGTLPGVTYMDLPDGGSPTVAEQLSRMAKDAESYRWLLSRIPGFKKLEMGLKNADAMAQEQQP